MAELLAAGGWTTPNSLGSYLRNALPDDYFVVADPILRGCPIAAVVVGRAGLFLLHPLDNEPAAEAGAGQAVDSHAARQQARSALALFLAEEFPALHPTIHEIKTARDVTDVIPAWTAAGDASMRETDLGQAIQASDGPAWAGDEEREALAVALRDRRLTPSQRATRPFLFRSGGSLRTGTQVWTVREAVQHMDRHPEDGVHHLRDGTLAAWLEAEGAPHLAQRARGAVNRPRVEPRAALEAFLIDTGLVERPTLHIAPRTIDLGYVVQGGQAARALRLRRGRGRGYLFGEVATNAAWLDAAPDIFQGSPAEAVVSANTAGLSIGPAPQRADVLVTSSASEEPIAVPAAVRVMALPSRANRALLRPLAGLLAAGLLGALIGALWAPAGVPVPAWLARVAQPGWLLILPIALVWALAGLIRAARQPLAWPIRYAALRWLGRAAGWAAGLALAAVAIVWAWQQGLGGGLALPGVTLTAVAAVAAAAGFFPATLDELANSRHAAQPEYVHGRRSRRRTVLLWAAGIALLLTVLLAPRLIAPLAQRLEAGALLAPARGWVTDRWEDLNRAVDDLLDKAVLRYYDRAAPTATPAPTPRPTPTPTS